MKVAVRADAGVAMGIGHVMRCLTLLEQLGKSVAGIDVLFICRDHRGHLADLISERGYSVHLLPVNASVGADEMKSLHARWLGELPNCDAEQTASAIQAHFGSMIDWLIVDHYGIDASWHRRLRTQAGCLMVIDDLADRQYDCDLLLDQTYGKDASRYLPWVNNSCRVLAGTDFALLREEFQRAGESIESFRNQAWPPRKLLVTLGGGDPNNVTGEVLEALAEHRNLFDQVTVVLGHANPYMETLRENYQSLDVTLLQAVSNMAQLMREHDLAIGAAGSTSWERCAVGLPTVSVVAADNQKTIASKLQAAGAVQIIECPITAARLYSTLALWLDNRTAYIKAVRASINICDGHGATRVCKELVTL